MAIKIQVRRGTAANWTSTNPTLAAGEVAFETDTGKIKVGTGSTAWTSLAYAAMTPTQVTAAVAGGVTTANAYTDSTANANLALHEGDTTTHGVTGYIVGTTDAQTLTNKTMGDTLLMNNNQISGLGTPTQSTHAATKAYVDAVSESLNIHDAVKVATTANITISTALVAGQVIDGITLASTNRVLVKNQTTTSQNGIYTVQASGAAVRASDYNSVPEVEIGDFIFVTSGTANASTGYVQTSIVTTIDTDPITFTQFSGSGTYVAGTGITLTSNSFAIDALVVPTITSTNSAVAQGLVDAKAYTDAEIIEHNVNANVHGIADFTLLATTVSPTFTGTVVLPSTTSIGNVSSTEIDVLNGLTASTAELNILDGVTSSTAELNILDGVTSTAAELNILDGVTASTSELNILDGVTATAAELNILDGATLTVTELNYVDGVTSAIQTQLNNKAPIANPTFTGTVAGITKSMVGLGSVNDTADADKPVSTATQTALDAKLSLAGGTMTGKITLDGDPSSALHATTKQYVDNTASGIVAKPQVLGATTVNIDATYNNGTAGVGATLTHNTNGEFPSSAGGASGWAVGKGILVKNQTNKAQNGRYYISNMGSASTPYVLTRCPYCDEASEIPGAYIFVQDGTSAGTGWIQVVEDPATFVVGTDNIDVFQFSGSGTITAGTNISVSGNQVSVVAAPTFSGLVTASATGVAFSDGTQTKIGVPSISTISQKTDSYTLASLTERDVILEISKASAATLTIPTDATVNYPVGTTLDIIQTDVGQVTIAGAVGVTVNATPGLKLRTQWSSATLLKRASNTWLVFGDLSA